MRCPNCHRNSLKKDRIFPVLSLENVGKMMAAKDYIICTECGMKAEIQYPPKTVRAEFGGTACCMTSDGRKVNMAEELNRLEK